MFKTQEMVFVLYCPKFYYTTSLFKFQAVFPIMKLVLIILMALTLFLMIIFRYYQYACALPSISSGDSIDWKEPTPEEIVKKVTGGVKSGSIVLFHNDLENTTQALPQVLELLSGKGYEFVPVGELIYTSDYTIDANGMQIPTVQSSTVITPDNADEVLAQYSDDLKAAGFTDEQLNAAVQAVKDGAEIPEQVAEVLAGLSANAVESAADTTSTSAEYEK